eukprot:8317676-Pyramimonas_sp.AAC.1
MSQKNQRSSISATAARRGGCPRASAHIATGVSAFAFPEVRYLLEAAHESLGRRRKPGIEELESVSLEATTAERVGP